MRRRLLIVPIVAAHGALLAMVAFAPGIASRGTPEGNGLSVFDVAAPAAAAPAETPPQPVAVAVVELPPIETPAPLELVNPAAPVLAAAGGADGTPCDLAAALTMMVRSDPAVAEAIAAIPATDRSVANAIMLWDGGWSADTRLLAVRARIAGLVTASRQECREEPQAGPRLIAMPAGQDTTILVLGSGRWKWADLITADATPQTLAKFGREAVPGATPPNRRVQS